MITNWATLSLVAFHLGRRLAGKAWGSARNVSNGMSGSVDGPAEINDLVTSVCERLGIKVRALPGGFLELRNGDKVSISYGSDFEFESIIPWRVCGDKALTSQLLQENGLPVADYASFSPLAYDKSLKAFKSMTKPVVVKPRTSTCHGDGVTTGISSVGDFRRAFAKAASFLKDVMIEGFAPGDNYRFLILKGEILCVIKRSPIHVVGDGKSSVRQLIASDLRYHIGRPRPPMNWIVDDECRQFLKNSNKSLKFVPANDEIFFLKAVCNRGPVEEVTDIVHEDFRRIAIRAAEILRAKFCTVDLICGSISQADTGGKTIVNEVNTSPGLELTGEPMGDLKPNEYVTETVVKELFHQWTYGPS